MLSFARVLVYLDMAKACPRSLLVDLEGDATVEVEVLYENIPCSACLSAGHLSTKCPYTVKPALLKSLVQTALLQITTNTAEAETVQAALSQPITEEVELVPGSVATHLESQSLQLKTFKRLPIPSITKAAS
ncbi:hypothetical protein CKAN_01663600 [Cinnamomum micranthum f. kanehirae]|uniref:Uncharacterized protein n=1 Tax=Cinnamomum micranthum f. kanehirae TaxID=337451 RepID=A0A443PA99_9MAGN|nr:hypothetical protein CKAN_01663600 [Cinnamomum micranthum f. kanehirae]